MNDKEKNKITTGTGSDYGFPFVEVSKLTDPVAIKALENKDKPKDIQAVEKAEPVPVKIADKGFVNPAHSSLARQKKSTMPVMLSVILLLVVILGAMAYFLYFTEDTPSTPSDPVISENVTPSPATPTNEQVTENPENDAPLSTEDSLVINEEAPRSLQPGQANIANADNRSQKIGEVFKIQGKEERSYFHIIVGSVRYERMANEEVEGIIQKGYDTWVIMPDEESRNYRLSIGKFVSFQRASEALEEAKPDFDDTIWIFKY